jgi:uncharacterized repeat protein (TIGR03803 family)
MYKKIYPLLLTLLCLLFYVSHAQAQKRIWGTFDGGVYHVKLDGSEFVTALVVDSAFGDEPRGISQTSDGSIIGVNGDWGPESGGSLFKLSSTGAHRLATFDYPGPFYATEVSDGQYCGVRSDAIGRGGSTFRINADGSGYSENYFTRPLFGGNNQLIKASNGLIYGLQNDEIGERGYVYRVDASTVTIVHYLSTVVGRNPIAKFIEGGDGFLYAPAIEGGRFGHGTVFKMSLDGSILSRVCSFDSIHGARPLGELAIDGAGVLYGTTESGGTYNKGVIYKVNKNGTGFTVLHHFNGEWGSGFVVLDGNTLYGTSFGPDYTGFIFSIHTDGTGYRHVYDFPGSYNTLPQDRLIIIDMPPVPAVSLVTPANGTTDVAVSGTMSSNVVAHALSYQLQLSLSASFSTVALTVNSSTNNFSVSGLTLSTTYYARVKTNVLPGYGATTSFTTGTAGEKKLWGVLTGYPGKIYNVNLDGSDYANYFEPVDEDVRGSNPQNLFKLNDGSILAVTYQGGLTSSGTLLKINSSGLTKLVDWESYPFGRRVYITEGNDGVIYGIGTSATQYSGRLFKLRSDGTGYSYHVFGHYGFWPDGNLLKASNGSIYGMSVGAGPGWIYTVNTDLSNVTPIFNFSTATGKRPHGGLIEAGGYLYGVASEGGLYNKGTVFKIKLDGTGFVKLHDFNGTLGRAPMGDLVYDGINTLYGITSAGGASDLGTLFKINIDGTGFGVLHHFNTAVSTPGENLALDGNVLFGHAGGGTFNIGALYSIHTDGSGFAVVENFVASSSYYGAVGNLIISNGVFPAARRSVDEDHIAQSAREQDGEAHISPNPFTNDFSVVVKSHRDESVAFHISDIQGKTVLSSEGVSNQMYHLGDALTSGVYILKVKSGLGMKYYRVVKK